MNYTCLKETIKILRFSFATNSVDDLEPLPFALSSFLRSNLPIQFIYTIFRKVTQSQTPVCPSAQWAFPQPEASGCFTLTNKRCLELNSSPSNWLSSNGCISNCYPTIILLISQDGNFNGSYLIFIFPTHLIPNSSQFFLYWSQDFLSTPVTTTLIQPLFTLLLDIVRAFSLVSLNQAFLSRPLYIWNLK